MDYKKIKSLTGLKNHISTIRYFNNDKDYNEYLIAADINYMVIIWDITDDYNIKYQIETQYDSYIYSCLIVFPLNINNNYFITSTCNVSKTNSKSATKIYLLDNGKFHKYINDSNNNEIYYLLSW